LRSEARPKAEKAKPEQESKKKERESKAKLEERGAQQRDLLLGELFLSIRSFGTPPLRGSLTSSSHERQIQPKKRMIEATES